MSRALIAALAAIIFGNVAVASPISGDVTAAFTDPVLNGSYYTLGGTWASQNNTATAQWTNVGPLLDEFNQPVPNSSFIQWGDNTPSYIGFVGNTLVNQAPDTFFDLGHVYYGNGSSFVTSLIFGATMTINIPGVTPLPLTLMMVATENGTGSPLGDADYVIFLSMLQAVGAYEGSIVSATLQAKIVGDPAMSGPIFQLDPGQGINGFALPSNVLPVPPNVPLPASLPMFVTGLAGLGWLARRKRKPAA